MDIRPIRKTDTTTGFSCGVPILDTYLEKRAWDHDQARVARVFVAEDTAAGMGVLGFYTLAASNIDRERVKTVLPKSMPPYPLPVIYIGYFAVQQGLKRQGIGRALLGDALRRCEQGTADVGAVGVFLDSYDADSTAFYRALGFVEIPHAPDVHETYPQPMFLAMHTLRLAKPQAP